MLDVGEDALSVERMMARIDEKLSIVEYSAIANVAVLSRINRDVPILLVTSL